MDEIEAIAQLKEGNVSALRTLIEMYQVPAVQAAILITQDRAVAEDVVQNAFLRSYHRIEQFDTSRPYRPWLLRIVVNDALKAVAKQKRLVPLDTQAGSIYHQLIERLDATTTEPEDVVQRNELRDEIKEAINKLSPRQRAVIILHYYLGLSEREISDKLNCTPGTVKWHLNIARERLQTLLFPVVE